MPNIKLYYGEFPFWRAEVSRLALHLGKVGGTFKYMVDNLLFTTWPIQNVKDGYDNYMKMSQINMLSPPQCVTMILF